MRAHISGEIRGSETVVNFERWIRPRWKTQVNQNVASYSQH